MNTCAKIVADELKKNDINFMLDEAEDGEVVLSIPNQNMMVRCFFSGDDGEYLLLCVHYDSVPDNKFADALLACNALNGRYRWCTFFIDDENDLMATYNAILNVDNAMEETMELIAHMMNILDDAKPVLMKALYS